MRGAASEGVMRAGAEQAAVSRFNSIVLAD